MVILGGWVFLMSEVTLYSADHKCFGTLEFRRRRDQNCIRDGLPESQFSLGKLTVKKRVGVHRVFLSWFVRKRPPYVSYLIGTPPGTPALRFLITSSVLLSSLELSDTQNLVSLK